MKKNTNSVGYFLIIAGLIGYVLTLLSVANS